MAMAAELPVAIDVGVCNFYARRHVRRRVLPSSS